MWSLFSHYSPKAFHCARALSESSCHPNWTQRELVKTAAAGKVSTVLLQPELVPPVQPHRSAAGPTVPVLVQPVLGSGALFLYLASFLLLSPLLMGAEVPSLVHPHIVSARMDTWPPTYTVSALGPSILSLRITSHVRASPLSL